MSTRFGLDAKPNLLPLNLNSMYGVKRDMKNTTGATYSSKCFPWPQRYYGRFGVIGIKVHQDHQ